MKTVKSVMIIALISLSGLAYSQSGWIKVTDSVHYLWPETVQMTSINTGYACGWYYYYKNASAFVLPSGAFFKTTNGGQNWQRTDNETKTLDDICFLNDLTGYMIAWKVSNGFILKTTNAGVNWITQDSVYGGNFFRIKFYDVNTGLVAGKYGEAYKTTNGGINWVNVNYVNQWSEPVSAWCVDANNWFVSDGSKLARTTNQGTNWTTVDSMYGGAICFINQSTGYNFGAGVYRTTNSGNNWTKIYNSVLGYIVSASFVDYNTGYICKYSANNILKTTNGGYNWTEINVAENQNFYSLSFINSQTGFVAGNHGIIYKTTNGGSVFVANISSEVPDKFELGQNYPNPFNQFSILNFKCKIKSMVSLKVFDVTGREVQTLVNEVLAPGTYQVRFDGSGLASGLYYYSMSIDGKQTAVKKMVMVK